MGIRDRNIPWKYGYKYIPVNNMTGRLADLSLDATVPALADIDGLTLVAGLTVAEGDIIHDVQMINEWYIDHTFGMDFRVLFADTTATGNNDTVWTLDYLFRKDDEPLITPIAASESVTSTQVVDNSATNTTMTITPWAALATYTYIKDDDTIMIWSITYTTNGDIADDAADLMGVEFRYTREMTTQIREETTPGS